MPAALNLIKLCVGVEHPDQLETWQAQRMAKSGASNPVHVTRMWPKREAELVDGGSIYWVMNGAIKARQEILRLSPQKGDDGIDRCCIILDANIVRTLHVPRRPFQGWRYLAGDQAPPDGRPGASTDDPLPEPLALALAQLGVR